MFNTMAMPRPGRASPANMPSPPWVLLLILNAAMLLMLAPNGEAAQVAQSSKRKACNTPGCCETDADCTKTNPEHCCSSAGYCGAGTPYCGEKCNTPGCCRTDADCIKNNPEHCCSSAGYCGTGIPYCGEPCTTPGCCRRDADCTKTNPEHCCSSAGFCGAGQAYCGLARSSKRRRKACDTPGCCETDADCAKNPGFCCSSAGYCGSGAAYCGEDSNSTALPPPAGDCLTTKECEDRHGPGYCCSPHFYCGNTAEHCATGPECTATKHCPLQVCCSQHTYCGTTEEFCNGGCLSNCGQAAPPPAVCPTPLAVHVGYFASWAADRTPCGAYGVNDIPAGNYTHVIYSFVNISQGVLVIDVATVAVLQAFVKRVHAGGAKAMIAVGGWTFNDNGTPTQFEFQQIAATSANRSLFARSVVSVMLDFDLDGLDIDWEYPGAPDRGGKPEDFENYVSLLKEIKDWLLLTHVKPYFLTIAAPLSFWYLKHFDVAAMHRHLDWINVMAYDIHGVWDADSAFTKPLLRSHTNITEILDGLNMFVKAGVPRNKLVMGLGHYGRSFTAENRNHTTPADRFRGPGLPGPCTNEPGILAWYEIDHLISQHPTGRLVHDSLSESVYFVYTDPATDTAQWIGFDDWATLAAKQAMAAKQCLHGTMVWSTDLTLGAVDLAAVDLAGVVESKQHQQSSRKKHQVAPSSPPRRHVT